MSCKNKGADQLRGYSRGDLRISFRMYKKGFTISLYSLGGGGGGRRLHLAKIKVQISCAVTAEVICAFVFACTKRVLLSACIPWGGGGRGGGGRRLSFILYREKTCLRFFDLV